MIIITINYTAHVCTKQINAANMYRSGGKREKYRVLKPKYDVKQNKTVNKKTLKRTENTNDLKKIKTAK